MAESKTDEVYYEHAMSLSLARRVALIGRTRMFDHFMTTMRPTDKTTILDFGVSEATHEIANMLEARFPYPSNITCVGIGDGHEVRAAYPQVAYRSIEPNVALPFAAKTFDIAYSNAVFEHLATDDLRRFFLRELLRVARRIYISVPNRWFPVEHHTALPLVHFAPALFRRLTRNGKHAFWSEASNLSFLGKSELRRLAPESAGLKLAYTGITAGPFSSNITIFTP